jgi:Helix-turn-helix.
MEETSKEVSNRGLAIRLKYAFERKVEREAEHGRKYTKSLLALKMNESRQVIQQWFRSGSMDKFKALRLSGELGVTIDWLLTGRYDIDTITITTPRVKALVALFQQLEPEDQEHIYQEMLELERRKREKIDALFNLK